MKHQIMELIDKCNSQKGTPTMFLREVRTASGLSLVLANERRLDDIERLGTRSPLTVLDVDLTSNICDYNVTISLIDIRFFSSKTKRFIRLCWVQYLNTQTIHLSLTLHYLVHLFVYDHHAPHSKRLEQMEC